jgi:soluble cytochrome b562
MESNINHLKAWVSAFNKAVVQAYKKIGHCRITNIKNEINTMEETYFIKSDADIDAYNAQIDIFMNQIERITACMNAADVSDHTNTNNECGICALFHGNEAILKDGGLIALLSHANYPEHLYYDYYDDYDNGSSNNLKINVSKQGFDVIYDFMLNNGLFSTIETQYIKNELQMMRASVIMEICKNDSHQIKRRFLRVDSPY